MNMREVSMLEVSINHLHFVHDRELVSEPVVRTGSAGHGEKHNKNVDDIPRILSLCIS